MTLIIPLKFSSKTKCTLNKGTPRWLLTLKSLKLSHPHICTKIQRLAHLETWVAETALALLILRAILKVLKFRRACPEETDEVVGSIAVGSLWTTFSFTNPWVAVLSRSLRNLVWRGGQAATLIPVIAVMLALVAWTAFLRKRVCTWYPRVEDATTRPAMIFWEVAVDNR